MNGTPEHFNENKRTDLTGADIRFTTKGGVLYAFAMGRNATETRIVSLAALTRAGDTARSATSNCWVFPRGCDGSRQTTG